jgi:hypothetical protein
MANELAARRDIIATSIDESYHSLEKGKEVIAALNILRSTLRRPPLRFDFEAKLHYLESDIPGILERAFSLYPVAARKACVQDIASLLWQWQRDLLFFFEIVIDSILLAVEHIEAKDKAIGQLQSDDKDLREVNAADKEALEQKITSLHVHRIKLEEMIARMKLEEMIARME